MAHITSYKYQHGTQLLTSIEWILKHDAIADCKENRVTLSTHS